MLGLREQIEAASNPEELAAAIAKAESSPKWTVSTLTEVAEFFGVATSTCKGWRMESPPMPGSDSDGWPLDAITRWRHQKIIGSDLATEKKSAELENLKLQNEQRRLALAKERGVLVERADVERFVATACIEFREMVMGLVEILSVSAPPALRDFVRAESDRHCRDALKALQRRLDSDELDRQTTTGIVSDGADEPQIEKELNHAEH